MGFHRALTTAGYLGLPRSDGHPNFPFLVGFLAFLLVVVAVLAYFMKQSRKP